MVAGEAPPAGCGSRPRKRRTGPPPPAPEAPPERARRRASAAPPPPPPPPPPARLERLALGAGAEVALRRGTLPAPEAAALLARLLAEVPWSQLAVRVCGRLALQPRLSAYQADTPRLAYRYSGAALAPAAWHPAVAALRARVEEETGARFNSCLLNRYRDGRDCVGWHSDDERCYGAAPVIASLSLGAVRDFALRPRGGGDGAGARRVVALGAGDLLVMRGETQARWAHSVPRRARCAGERVSLTFRLVLE